MPSKHTRLTTPVGTARWPRLSKPDTKFDKDGVYKVDLILSADDAAPVKTAIEEVMKAHIAQVKKEKPNLKKRADMPFVEEVDDGGNETGNWVFKFKLKAVGVNGEDRWEQRPLIIDSQTKPIDSESTEVGQGSLISVGCEIIPYISPMVGVGISLRLKVVQVVDLRESGSSVDDNWGFDVVEGFVANEQTSIKSEVAEDFEF
tara:strand:- start:421 stop:1029 length:609 start_codon:yes stop_codon:yes gene_type:complete